MRPRGTAHTFAQTLMRVPLDLMTFLGIFHWVRGSHYQRDQNVLFRMPFFPLGQNKVFLCSLIGFGTFLLAQGDPKLRLLLPHLSKCWITDWTTTPNSGLSLRVVEQVYVGEDESREESGEHQKVLRLGGCCFCNPREESGEHQKVKDSV